jgi:predicted GNAT superfamily acetyltransferase
MTISIRPPATIEEYEVLEWLQAEIWGTGIGITPGIFLYIIAKEGGVVLLAFDDDQPVGFAYGFLGLAANNRIKLASHQTGVLSAYQDSGLGYKLKLAQRQAVLAKNIDHITWTFDPLQGRNARFNLRKLGAVCNTYLPNLYGDMPDELNQGLPSDRFRVDWWLVSGHVNRRISGQIGEPDLPPEWPVLNPTTKLEQGLVVPTDTFDLPSGDLCLVEIPSDLSALKKEAPDMALKWRLQTREIFEAAFRTGYTVIDLLRREGRNYYLLQKDWQLK